MEVTQRRIIVPEAKTDKVVKPGWKTTEFWMAIASMAFGALASGGYISAHEASQATSTIGTIFAGLGGFGYAISRGFAKR